MVKKKAGRPESIPTHLDPTGMDLEQRRHVLWKVVNYSDLSPSAQATIEGTAIQEIEILRLIILSLRRVNLHLSLITDEEITEEDVAYVG
ncbi:hypothetical protein LCGC14_2822990 [marine sediment metagenome]|uniref:Uncharacterized protein n=1 Tax=marine sediment metagenome TaxID=412755 RepID=A0A0F9B7L2_9ZZZZ